MSTELTCNQCGARLEASGTSCTQCSPPLGGNISPKSPTAVLLTSIFMGTLGIHRFYVGKIFTGLLMLLTAGGFGIWYLIDIARVVCNQFTDRQGRIVEVSKHPSTVGKVMLFFVALFTMSFLFFGSIIGLLFYCMGGMTDVVDHQLQAIRSGNLDKAYSYSSSEFKKGVPLVDFKNFVNHFPQLKNSTKASFKDRSFKDNDGKLRGKLFEKDGSVAPIEYELKYEHNQWMIQSFTVKPAVKQ